MTYSSSGALIRQLDRTQPVDGVPNCITNPVIDRNDNLYGVPYGQNNSGSWVYGSNLLAYSGNTLKWKYPLGACSNGSKYAVGATGNIYATSYLSDGLHLIGLTPEVGAGQSQPAKILDVKVANDCSIGLFPYKDGIVLRGQNNGYEFYSYNGQLISQLRANDYWRAKVNAAGHLFDYKIVSGSNTSANVIKLDPASNNPIDKSLWTTSASTPGANVQNVQLYPLSSGGVVALIREQKMFSPSVPATPTVYVYTLVTINTAGLRTGATTLENSNAQGTFGAPYAAPTSDGRLAFVRDFELNTGRSYPSTIPALAVGVYNPATNDWDYQQILTGDLNKPGGPSGYAMEFSVQDSALAPTANTLSFLARCSGSCPYAGGSVVRKLYSLAIPGIGGDYPRGAVLTVPLPLKPYVVLGDSFSSGQGAGTYNTDTVTDTNKCYKSYNGFGRILGRDTSSPLTLTNFAACGGSITDNIDTNTTYPGVLQKQDQALSSNTKVVSLTIGGNDIGFGDVIRTCADPTKDCDGAYNLAYNQLSILDNKLQRVYLDILKKAPNAKVYVLGYPPIVTTGPGCLVGKNGTDFPFFSEPRKQKAVDLANSLNYVIQNNVSIIRSLNADYNQRLTFIDVQANGSPFIGHDVCSSEPYVNGLVLPPVTLPRASIRIPGDRRPTPIYWQQIWIRRGATTGTLQVNN